MKNIPDYSLVVLSDYEQALFDRFKNSDTATMTLEEFRALLEKGLVTNMLGGKSDMFDSFPTEGACAISQFGKGLRAYQVKQARIFAHTHEREKKQDRFSWAALIISVVALLLSLTSISWQIYTWREERSGSRASQSQSATTAVQGGHLARAKLSDVG